MATRNFNVKNGLTAGTITLDASTGNATANNVNAGNIIYANNNIIVGSNQTEGGQLVLGYVGINGIAGQANSTWNIDVDNSNTFRIFTQYANGVASTPIYLYNSNNNIVFPANATASYFIGNGSQLTGITASFPIANGTSNIAAPAAGGNINISVAGNANILVVTGTGVNVAGTLNASGNANVGNLGTAQVLASANVTAPQLISNVATGTAPFVVTSTTQVANLNVATSGSATNAAAVQTNTSTSSTVYLAGVTSSANGNSALNIVTGITANYAANSITATTFTGSLVGNVTANGSNGTVIANNHTASGAASGNINVSTITGNLGIRALTTTYTDNVAAAGTVANAAIHAIATPTVAASNAITTTNLATFYIAGAPAAGTNVTITNGYALYVGAGNSLFNGNVTVGNLGVAFVGATANVTAPTLISNVATGTAPLTVTSTTRVSNLNVANAGFADSTTNAAAVLSNTSTNTTVYLTGTSTSANGNVALEKVTGIFANMGNNSITATQFVGTHVGNVVANTANGTVIANNITASGAATGNANVSTITGNLGIRAIFSTYTDNVAAASATIANAAVHALAAPNLAAVNASVTFTNAATFYIAGAPVANGTTITNPYSLYVGSGNSFFGGNILGTLANGNSSVNIPAANGNVNISAVGNTTLVVTGTGVNVAGTLNTGTGVITGNGNGLSSLQAANITGTLPNAVTNAISNVGTLTSLTANGNVTVNTAAGNRVAIIASAPPTVDMLQITNSGQGVTTAGINGIALTYVGGAAAVESSAQQIDLTPGGTTGGTWNGYRMVAASNAASGVTMNAVKIDALPSAGTGSENALYVGANWDNILNYNGTAVIFGNGIVNAAQVGANVSSANVANVANFVSQTTQTTGTYFFALSNASGTGNVSINANANVNVALATGTINAPALNITGNANVGNIITGSGTGGNITGANYVIANFFTGTLTTAAQPNITSVGTLTGLTIGNATSNAVIGNGTIVLNSGLITGNGNGLSSLQAANVTGALPNAVTNNITNVGTITSGTWNSTFTAGLNANTLANIQGTNVSGAVASATSATNAAALLQNTSTATTAYPTFTTSSANGNAQAFISTGISANLGNNSITATTFVGALSGAATSATNAAAVQTNASTATSVFPTFVTASTNANYALNTVSGISANLANNSITATTFVGALSGAATSATSATNAAAVLTNTSTNTTVYLTGTQSAANGNISLEKVTGIFANMGNNSITATQFVGTHVGNVIANTSNGRVVANSITTSGAASGNINVLSSSGNLGISALAATYTDNVSAAGTIANAAIHTIAIPTVAASNAITTTNLATFYVEGAPTAGTNVTITNGYALHVGAGNSLFNGNVTANYFIGNGSQLTGITASQITGVTSIANGNSNVNIPAANGNVNISAAGNANILVVSGTGANINGNALINGQVIFGSSATANGAFYYDPGNRFFGIYNSFTSKYYGISGAFPGPAGTSALGGYYSGLGIGGTSNNTNTPMFGVLTSTQSGNGIGATAFTIYDNNKILTFNNTLDDGSGNANLTNLGTGRVIATGNISGTQLISNIATGTAPLVVSSTTKVANLNVEQVDGFDASQSATANTIVVRDANANVSANFFIGNGSQLTGITTISGFPVSNGNSNIYAPQNGNVSISVTGVANIVTVTSANMLIGSGTGGNIAGANVITANTFVGVFANGNSNISIPAANGNVNISAVGNANILVVTGTGANITGTANISGNANVGNIGATSGVFTGNVTISGANSVIFANSHTVSGAMTGNANAVGTITGNLGLRALSSTYTDNSATAGSTIANAAVHGIGAPTLAAANLTVTATNAASFYIEGAPIAGTNMTITNPYSLLVETGNAFFGGNILGTLANGNSSVNIPAANGNVNISAVGNTTLVVTGTGANITGTLNTGTGNANVGNLGTTTIIATTGNITTVNGNVANASTIIANAANGVVFANSHTASGAMSGNANVSTVTGNLGIRALASTYTDNVAAAGTVANAAIHAIGTPTLVASNAITTTNLSTFFIQAAPVASTNVTATNSYALFVASGNAFFGGNIIGTLANGNSSVNIPAANGNVNISAVGNTTLVVTGTGANITGTLNTGTGNANVGNIGAATAILTTAANTPLVQNGTSNVAITSGANVTIGVAGTARITATSTGANINGTLGISGNTTGANIISNNYHIFGVTNSITAAGSTQATATVLTKDINIVTTVTTGANGVALPNPAVAGMRIVIVNTSANALNVYPQGNGIINGLAANTAFSHGSNVRLEYLCAAAATAPGGTWYTM